MSERPNADPIVRIDETYARVTEWRFAPGAETGWHRHEADYVVVPLADGELLLEEPGGGSRKATLKRHAPYSRREGVEHNVVNANAYDFAFIEIECMKGGDTGRLAALDSFVAAWNAHDLDAIMRCFTDDCAFWSSSGPHPEGGVFEGREAVREATAAIFRAFPDAAWTESSLTLAGERAFWEWTFVGTAAGGEKTRVRGMDALDLVGDKVRRKTSFRKTVTKP
jgi:beta-alanine degradation protein BauB